MSASSKINTSERKERTSGPSSSVRRTSLLTMFTVAAVLLIPGEATSAQGASRPSSVSTPDCVTTNKITVKIVGSKKVATSFDFAVAFTNDGDLSCFLAGFPNAQPVVGVTPTGPDSGREKFAGVGTAHVLLSAQGGRAYSEYRVMSTGDFAKNRCRPIFSNGVAFTIGKKRLISPIRLSGATSVCSVVASTWIGPFAHKPYA